MKTGRIAHAALAALPLLVSTTSAYAKDSDAIRRGALTAISASAVTVGGMTCATNSGTEYENLQSQRIPRSSFTVGDIVKLTCRSGVAHSLEMENDIGGSSQGNDDPSNHDANDDSRIRLDSRLDVITGVDTDATVRVSFRDRPNRTARDDRFVITLKLPIPSTVPVAANLQEARQLSLSASLARDGTPYALCTLRFDHSDLQHGRRIAEFKTDLKFEMKSSRLRLRSSKGSCDIDLNTAGVQKGFPQIQSGDTIVVSDSLAGEILSGTL